MALGSLHKALTPKHTAADGNLGLDHVIPCPERIQFRIQKNPDTVPLVFMQKPPQHGSRTGKHPHQHSDPLQFKATDPEHGKSDSHKNQSRPQIRLPQHQHKGNHHKQTGRNKIFPLLQIFTALIQKGSQTDNHKSFGKLAGLECHRTDLDPALRPETGMTKKHNPQQQQNRKTV